MACWPPASRCPKKQPWRTTAFGQLREYRDGAHGPVQTGAARPGKGADELYDLKADPGETDQPYEDPQFLTVRTSLTAELAAWRGKYSG